MTMIPSFCEWLEFYGISLETVEDQDEYYLELMYQADFDDIELYDNDCE